MANEDLIAARNVQASEIELYMRLLDDICLERLSQLAEAEDRARSASYNATPHQAGSTGEALNRPTQPSMLGRQFGSALQGNPPQQNQAPANDDNVNCVLCSGCASMFFIILSRSTSGLLIHI